MNSYLCYYRGKTVTIQANSIYHAQQQAAFHFKAKKAYQVNTMLCEKEGETVTHSPCVL